MSLLALLAATAEGGPPPPGSDTTPYEFPSAAPYNVPVRMITPTPDGTGQAVHPSVVDFQTQHGVPLWNGHRYWMAITPYANGDSGVENPCILTSSDGYTWAAPAGLTNPIASAGATGYNSDTDLVYDPDTNRLWCFWREHNHSDTSRPIGELMHTAWSTNGSTWTKVEQVIVSQMAGNEAQSGLFLSPGVVRVAAGDWRLISIGRVALSSGPRLWTATAPTGPWVVSGPATFTWTGRAAQEIWHFGMTRFDGTFHALLDINGPNTQAVFAATSTDAQTWNVAGASPVIDVASGWDLRPYRACLTPHEDGTKARVWYSASNSVSPPYEWNTGYTQAPLSEWPAPPTGPTT